jgi:hypothetical protein
MNVKRDKMGAIRIQSGKDIHSVKVIDTYSGEEIWGIVDMEVTYDVENGMMAHITLIPEEVDLLVEKVEVQRMNNEDSEEDD